MTSTESNLPPLSASRRWLHRYAVFAACATFPLVFVGGLVTSYNVGMAVTDWPTTQGQNMFAYPWLMDLTDSQHGSWGVFVEHSHRLLGSVVGVLTIALAAWLWFGDSRRWMRWLGVVALAGVIVQGVLGGVRVLANLRGIGVVHACAAQAFFALMVSIAVFTSPTWLKDREPSEASDAGRLRRLALTTTAFVYAQLILGALLRHLAFDWALVAHLVVALMVVVHVALLAKRVFVSHAARPALVKLVEILGALTVVQLMLGAGAWAKSSGFGDLAESTTTARVVFATAHMAVGAIILAACVVFTLFAYRDVRQAASPATERRSREAAEIRSSRAAAAQPTFSSLEPRDLIMSGGRA